MASLKVGVISGLTTGILWAGMRLLPLPDRDPESLLWQGLFSVAIAGFSGFLFGITYRHMIRHERDDHLQSGTVGAFGLVRGLAQVQPNHFSLSEGLLAGITLGESLLLFILAKIVLNICFDRRWIERFPIKS